MNRTLPNCGKEKGNGRIYLKVRKQTYRLLQVVNHKRKQDCHQGNSRSCSTCADFCGNEEEKKTFFHKKNLLLVCWANETGLTRTGCKKTEVGYIFAKLCTCFF